MRGGRREIMEEDRREERRIRGRERKSEEMKDRRGGESDKTR